MTDETTPDAVSLVHELLYAASQQGPEETDQVADRLLSAIHAERARHAEEVAALRGQLGRFERARHDLDRLVQYVLENEDVENPSDVAALMSAGIVEHLLAVLNQEAPGD